MNLSHFFLHHRRRAIPLLLGLFTLTLDAMAALPLPDLDIRLKGAWPPYDRASAEAIVASHDHAYLAAGEAGLLVFDVSTPAQPRFVTALSLPGFAAGLGFWSEYLLVANQGDDFSGFHVIDVHDPAQPRVVTRVAEPGSLFDGAISGTRAVVLEDTLFRIEAVTGVLGVPKVSILRIIDVSNPKDSRTLTTFAIGADAREVALSGSLALVANGIAGLQIVDVSNPERPNRLADFLDFGRVSSVTAAGTNVFLIGNNDNGNGNVGYVLDISDPRHPRIRGSLSSLDGSLSWDIGGVLTASASGDRVFLFRYASPTSWELEVLDLSDPDQPRRLLQLDGSWPALVPVSLHFQYIPDAAGGWVIHDVTEPGNPVRVGSYRAIIEALGGVLVGNRVHTSDGVLYDVSDPAQPRPVGEGLPAVQARSGNLGCRVDYDGGLQCYDLSDPRAPRLIGRYAAGDRIKAVELRGTDAFVAAGAAGLQIVDLSRPSALTRGPVLSFPPSEVRVPVKLIPAGDYFLASYADFLQVINLSDPSRPERLSMHVARTHIADTAVSGRFAYVAEWGIEDSKNPVGGRLAVVDLGDPIHPREVGALELNGPARGVAVAGSTAFVAAGPPGLIAVNITDPTRPVETGRFDTGGSANDVVLVGSYALVAAWPGFQVIDISQPSQLRRVAGHPVNGTYRIEVAGNLAYVWHTGYTGNEAGLLVFNVTDPTRPQLTSRIALTRGYGSAVIFNDYVFAVNESGLVLLDLKDPLLPRRIVGNSAIDPWYSPFRFSEGTLFVHDNNNNVVTFSVPPFFRSMSRTDTEIRLEWEGWGRARLQRANVADASGWQDVPGTESLTSTAFSLEKPNEFFRLYQP